MTELDPNEFLYTGNQIYIAEMYERFLDDPSSVDPRWQAFFSGLADEARDLMQEKKGASWAPSDAHIAGRDNLALLSGQTSGEEAAEAAPQAVPRMGAGGVREATLDSIRALMLIRSYRVRGHLLAKLDPLELEERQDHPELNPATYGFQDRDMDRVIYINYLLGLETATIREIMSILHQTYCGHIGIEFMHIQDPGEKAWLQERMESIQNQSISPPGANAPSSTGCSKPRVSSSTWTRNSPVPSVSGSTAAKAWSRPWSRSSSAAAN